MSARVRGLGLALVAIAWLTHAAEAGVTVRVAPDVTVRADEVTLGDVANVEGDEALAGRLRRVWLGPAPAPGATQRLDQSYLRLRLSEPQLEPANVRVIAPEQVVITRAFQLLPGTAVVEAAARPLQDRLDALDGAGSYAIVPLTRLGDLRIPAGAVALTPQIQGEPSLQSPFPAAVRVSVDGRPVQTIPLSFRADRYGTVVVAARALEARAALTPGDWRVDRRPATDIPSGALSAIPDGADLEPVRPIRAGEVLTPALVRPRVVVRRGELVTLVLEGPGFRITTQGVAAADARRGEAVRIVNPTSKRETLGRAEGAGLVRVPFGESGRDQ